MTLLKDLLTDQQPLVAVGPEATVREAAKTMADSNVGCVAVLEDQGLVGIFTERDLLRRVIAENRDLDRFKVSDVMTAEVVCGAPDDSVGRAVLLMRKHRIRHLPVVEDDQILGMLSIRDLLRDEMQEMRDYIARSE